MSLTATAEKKGTTMNVELIHNLVNEHDAQALVAALADFWGAGQFGATKIGGLWAVHVSVEEGQSYSKTVSEMRGFAQGYARGSEAL